MHDVAPFYESENGFIVIYLFSMGSHTNQAVWKNKLSAILISAIL